MKTAILVFLSISVLSANENNTTKLNLDDKQSVEVKDKGFFIGADLQAVLASSLYKLSTGGNVLYHYNNNSTVFSPNVKLGYSYYTTRVYVAYSYMHEQYDAYKIRAHTLNAFADYTPNLYKTKDYNLDLVVGIGIGVNYSVMYAMDATIKSNHYGNGVKLPDDFKQSHLNIMPEIGLLFELENSFSIEAGYRYMNTDVIENTSDINSNGENIESVRNQVYLGVNYIF